jgi:hypothetical protein
MKLVRQGIETAIINIYCGLPKWFLELLEAEKQKTHYDFFNFVDTENDVYSFEILNYGYKNYAYILSNEYLTIQIAKEESTHYPRIRIETHAKFAILYQLDLRDEIIYFLESIEAKTTKITFSRLDFYFDFVQVSKFSNLFPYFVTDKLTKTKYFHGKKVSGYSFGKRDKKSDYYLRVYNKTIEIRSKKKGYFWFDIWGFNQEQMANQDVIRFEFEAHAILKKHNKDFFEVLENLEMYSNYFWNSNYILERQRKNLSTKDNPRDFVETDFLNAIPTKFEMKKIRIRDKKIKDEYASDVYIENAIKGIYKNLYKKNQSKIKARAIVTKILNNLNEGHYNDIFLKK